VCNTLSGKWQYYPQEKVSGSLPVYGIVTGGTTNKFVSSAKTPDALYSTCIANLYARKHGYAFYVEKGLEYVHNRSYGSCSSSHMSPWNKLPLLQEMVDDVDVIVWLDMDAIIHENSFMTGLDKFLPSQISRQRDCFPKNIRSEEEVQFWKSKQQNNHKKHKHKYKHNDNHNKKRKGGDDASLSRDKLEVGEKVLGWSTQDLPGASASPFLWVTQDINPGYALNVNTAVMALRRGPQAKRLLERAWAVGEDQKYFVR
jgi:hypothetical protein